MSLLDQSAPISVLARSCLVTFQECLQGALNLGDTQRYSNLEDQKARFSIWTSNMAVFASAKACMDHRVREASEVRRLVLHILEVLQGRVSECASIIKHATETTTSIEARLSMLALGDFERTSEAIASQVSLLHELSNIIRKSSKDTQNVKAATSFRIKDDDGNDMEDCLRHYFSKALRDQYPDSSDAIRSRLCSTMILRRKRILYRRQRYLSKPAVLPIPAPKPVVQIQRTLHPRLINATATVERDREEKQPDISPSIAQSAMQSATTLAPREFQRASAPSVVSHTKTVDLGAHEDLVFPPKPHSQSHAVVEGTCPYCLFTIPAAHMSNQDKWKKHILGDLDALVCLFDPCDEPEILYGHSKDWLQHMRKHGQRWRCSAKSHSAKMFDSREEFDKHFCRDHGREYSGAQLDLLAERALQVLEPMFDTCPLCGGTDEPGSMGSLTDHIVGHLRALALKSLPPHYDDDDSLSSHSGDDGQDGSRSTLKDLLNSQKAPLAFSNASDHSTRKTDGLSNLPPSPASGLIADMMPGSSLFDQSNIIPSDDEEHEEQQGAPESSGPKFNITPTLWGFKEQILGLNPRLAEHNGYLIDRMAHQQVIRYKGLINKKVKHKKHTAAGSCPAGEMCESAIRLKRVRSSTAARIGTDWSNLSDVELRQVSFPATIECPLCYGVKDLSKRSDWTRHVLEDLQPFTCTWYGCREPKIFKRKSDWIRHENERHRHLEWWTCDVEDCRHTCYRMDNFLQHLVREHKYSEPKVRTRAALKRSGESDETRAKVEACHAETSRQPQDEPCRFCGKPLTTWKKLEVHLAEHMERISRPMLDLVIQHKIDENDLSDPSDVQNLTGREDLAPMFPSPTESRAGSPPRFYEGSFSQFGLEDPSAFLGRVSNDFGQSQQNTIDQEMNTAAEPATAFGQTAKVSSPRSLFPLEARPRLTPFQDSLLTLPHNLFDPDLPPFPNHRRIASDGGWSHQAVDGAALSPEAMPHDFDRDGLTLGPFSPFAPTEYSGSYIFDALPNTDEQAHSPPVGDAEGGQEPVQNYPPLASEQSAQKPGSLQVSSIHALLNHDPSPGPTGGVYPSKNDKT